MSGLSLILTSFDVGPWIDRALDSAAEVLRPGDELIVVDDASRDDGPARIRAFAHAGRMVPEVTYRPILLGCNTPGGVGPAANIGLAAASREIVAFLDGDDWLEVEGFDAVRDRFEALLAERTPADILIANYAEWHESQGMSRPPADAGEWHGAGALSGETARERALGMIAVPWRKLYRRDFLEARKLRFPEGDFFFEDNPFHWGVCRAARRIEFHDRVLCQHRVARPGQTMTSRGTELLAFFDHYRTITAGLGRNERRAQTLALCWLTQNMCWHMERLRPDAIAAWVAAARDVLADAPPRPWQDEVLPRYENWAREIFEAIRAGRADLAERRIMAIALTRQETQLERRLQELQTEVERLRNEPRRPDTRTGKEPAPDTTRTARLLQEFEAARQAVLALE